ncbi:CheR family methyltransferase [Dactylosporangium sp. NPDC049742]|uniref:CheR family methyltransferase n=1 Tax=Dactylosporangium sp. NPDC049742 TaxID=3154737 RepID=UPI00343ED2DD
MTGPDYAFEALLTYLKEARGFDFTGYKRSSLMRRVNRRIAQLGMHGYSEYLDQLQVHPDEFTTLFNTILINVTSFFRDSDPWDYLRAELIPRMLAESKPDAPLRIWSAGCASGEEAYTLAMLLCEVLGPDEFRRRVKIYATDVDEEGLAQARQAVYNERDVQALPDGMLERYFDVSGNRYSFRKDLRRSVIFGRNDLVQDAPISRIDLLVCRNTLMYFNAETQARILTRFHFALAPAGLLFLGKAEMLLSHASLFAPVDLKRRVFRRAARPAFLGDPVLAVPAPALDASRLTGLDRLRHKAFTAGPVAQIVITDTGLVALVNHQAETLFGLSSSDCGRPFRDLDLSYRPVELRGHIEKAKTDRRVVRVADVQYTTGQGEKFHLDVQIHPLTDGSGELLGAAIVFQDITTARRLQQELEHSNQQLEAAYEELQSTNEELETTNEELQSTVEELETTNEELQSTNEELETMNEELQSTNDELQAINEELQDRTGEVHESNVFLQAILSSLRSGVVVLDPELRVMVWNRRMDDLWGIRAEEAIGQHFLNLDIGLPTDQLRPLIRSVLGPGPSQDHLTLSAINRRGRPTSLRIAANLLVDGNDTAAGAILVMDPVTPTEDPAQPDPAAATADEHQTAH